MKTLNVHEAKTRLSAVLAEVSEKGQRFLICRNGEPVADLIPSCQKEPPDPASCPESDRDCLRSGRALDRRGMVLPPAGVCLDPVLTRLSPTVGISLTHIRAAARQARRIEELSDAGRSSRPRSRMDGPDGRRTTPGILLGPA